VEVGLELVKLELGGEDGDVKKVNWGIGGIGWFELGYLKVFYKFFLVNCQVFHDFLIFVQRF
jgi:hypothetical protein